MNSVFSVDLKNGQAWSAVIQKNKVIKITSKNDNPNVSALIYNADQPLERYNMPDTLKGQHVSKLCKGSCLHSDMGRLLLSVIDSSCTWHDPICGYITELQVEAKFGRKTFSQFRNEYQKNGYDNFLTELGKHGLGKLDIVPNVNFFSKVYVTDNGIMNFIEKFAGVNDFISLRTEMKVLLVISNTPHPLAPQGEYPGGMIKIEIGEADPIDVNKDVCYQSRIENYRAWQNTQSYLKLSE